MLEEDNNNGDLSNSKYDNNNDNIEKDITSTYLLSEDSVNDNLSDDNTLKVIVNEEKIRNPHKIPRLNFLTGWIAFLITMGANIVSSSLLVVVMVVLTGSFGPNGFDTSNLLENKNFVYFSLFITQAIIVIVCYSIIKFRRLPLKEVLMLRPPSKSLLKTILILLLSVGGILTLNFVLTFIWAIVSPLLPDFLKTYEEIAETNFLANNIYEFIILSLFIGIGAGVLEEVLFRGIIQNSFLQRISPMFAILLTSVLFGVMHLNFIQGITAFILGLYLGIIAYKTKSLFPVMLAHFANNFFSLLLAYLFIQ